jgi:hypothetical protein
MIPRETEVRTRSQYQELKHSLEVCIDHKVYILSCDVFCCRDHLRKLDSPLA